MTAQRPPGMVCRNPDLLLQSRMLAVHDVVHRRHRHRHRIVDGTPRTPRPTPIIGSIVLAVALRLTLLHPAPLSAASPRSIRAQIAAGSLSIGVLDLLRRGVRRLRMRARANRHIQLRAVHRQQTELVIESLEVFPARSP